MELPVSLHLQEWYAFSLADAGEQVRLVALEELTAIGLPPEFREAVTRIAAEDASPLCRERAASLLELDAKRGEAENLAAGFEATPQSLRDLFDQASPSLRKALLRVIWKPPSPELLDIWRDQMLSEQIPEVAAVGLSLLCRSGNVSDAVLGLSFLASESAEVAKAAMDLLYIRDREALKARLGGLLGHINPDIRFHAIRRLAGIDLREALQFLNAAIEGDDPMDRRRSIQELSLLPAQDAEPSFVRVLGLETQPLLLVIAGRALAAKPTLEMPPFIYDTFLMSKGVKRHILNVILRQVVQGIRDAGRLTEPIETYLENLHRELESRRADLAVTLVLRDLRHPEIEVRKQVLERLPPLLPDPRIQKALRTRLNIEPDAELKTRVAALLDEAAGIAENSAVDAVKSPAAQVVVSPGASAPGPADPLSAITSKETFVRERETLLRLLESSSERPLLVRVLKLFHRFGTAADAQHLMPLLKKKDGDPSVIGNALKAIAHLDFDAVSTAINPLLRDENLAIKAAALEVYVTCDKEGALHYLKSMLASPLPSVRRKALSIVPLVDGPSIEPLLLKMLVSDPQEDLQAQAGFLIASNPTEQGLKTLFRHTHPTGRQPTDALSELWETVRPAAAAFSGQPVETVDTWLEEKVKQEDAQPAADAGYAFDAVQGRKGPGGGEPEPAPKEQVFLTFDQYVALCGIFAAVFFGIVFLEEFGVGSSREYRRETQPSPSAVAGQAAVAPPTAFPTRTMREVGGWRPDGAVQADPALTVSKPRGAGWVTLSGSWMPGPGSGTK